MEGGGREGGGAERGGTDGGGGAKVCWGGTAGRVIEGIANCRCLGALGGIKRPEAPACAVQRTKESNKFFKPLSTYSKPYADIAIKRCVS